MSKVFTGYWTLTMRFWLDQLETRICVIILVVVFVKDPGRSWTLTVEYCTGCLQKRGILCLLMHYNFAEIFEWEESVHLIRLLDAKRTNLSLPISYDLIIINDLLFIDNSTYILGRNLLEINKNHVRASCIIYVLLYFYYLCVSCHCF